MTPLPQTIWEEIWKHTVEKIKNSLQGHQCDLILEYTSLYSYVLDRFYPFFFKLALFGGWVFAGRPDDDNYNVDDVDVVSVIFSMLRKYLCEGKGNKEKE